jgi:preprotein translocase YajC subunit
MKVSDMEIIPLLFVAIAFYFILLKPVMNVQKLKKKTISSLKIGDKVVFSGGLVAVIDEIIVTKSGTSLLKLILNNSTVIYSLPEAIDRLVEDDTVISNMEDIIKK